MNKIMAKKKNKNVDGTIFEVFAFLISICETNVMNKIILKKKP